MKVIIVEDEQLAADRLAEMLKKTDFRIDIEAILPSVESSIKWLSNNSCDLIFLDIHLSDGLCFKIFEKISTDIPVIFTTAYDNYAIEAFKLNSIDYLLKPISDIKLQTAINKYNRTARTESIDFSKIASLFESQNKQFKKRFLIQLGNKIKTVETDSVSCFYALDKSVYLLTFKNQHYTIDISLDRLEEQLDEEKFFRINRKIIINSEAIQSMESYTRGRVFIKLKTDLPTSVECIVSIEKSPPFKLWLNR